MSGKRLIGIERRGLVGGLGRTRAEAFRRRMDDDQLVLGTSHGHRRRVTIALGRSSARKGKRSMSTLTTRIE